MTFPDSPRVTYSKNPLVEVICQVRFPTILRIDTEVPAAFQDRIRSEFPLYEEAREEEQLPLETARDIPKELLRLLTNAGVNKSYDFKSLDKHWTLRLNRDFLALTANKYTVWEEFADRFRLPFEALIRQYKPALYTRVGLRYQNVITRSKLSLFDDAWSDLLNPELAGILGTRRLGSHVRRYVQVIGMELPQIRGEVNIRHGFVTVQGSTEESYLIDSDFFATDIQEKKDVYVCLGKFNREAGKLFRWGISARLHDSMEPIAVG